VAFGGVSLIQLNFVGGRLDAGAERQDLFVAGHDGDGLELQPLSEVHGADRHAAGWVLAAFGQLETVEASGFDRGAGAGQLVAGTDEKACLGWRDAFGDGVPQKGRDLGGLRVLVWQDRDCGLRAVKYRDGPSRSSARPSTSRTEDGSRRSAACRI
jgi:hypothetical protein